MHCYLTEGTGAGPVAPASGSVFPERSLHPDGVCDGEADPQKHKSMSQENSAAPGEAVPLAHSSHALPNTHHQPPRSGALGSDATTGKATQPPPSESGKTPLVVAAKRPLRWQWLVKGPAEAPTEVLTRTPLGGLPLLLPHLKTNPGLLLSGPSRRLL